MTDDPIRQMPGVEAIAKLHEVYRPDLRYQGVYLTAGEKVFYVNRDFLRTFDIEMLEGDMESALVAPDQVISQVSSGISLRPRTGGGMRCRSCLRIWIRSVTPTCCSAGTVT